MINSANGKAMQDIDHLVRGYLTRGEPRPVGPPPGPMPDVARERAGWYVPDNPRVQTMYFAERLLGLTRVTVTDSTAGDEAGAGQGQAVPAGLGHPVPRGGRARRHARLIEDRRTAATRRSKQMGYLLPTSYHAVPAILAWVSIGLVILFCCRW